MALDLESTIMREIGFGQHFTWHNGSSGCGGTRREALKRLPDALQRHHDGGEAIDPPHTPLLAFLSLIESEEEDHILYSLTRTWQASSDVIRAHMEAAANPDARQRVYDTYLTHLRTHYRKAASREQDDQLQRDPLYRRIQAIRELYRQVVAGKQEAAQ